MEPDNIDCTDQSPNSNRKSGSGSRWPFPKTEFVRRKTGKTMLWRCCHGLKLHDVTPMNRTLSGLHTASVFKVEHTHWGIWGAGFQSGTCGGSKIWESFIIAIHAVILCKINHTSIESVFCYLLLRFQKKRCTDCRNFLAQIQLKHRMECGGEGEQTYFPY